MKHSTHPRRRGRYIASGLLAASALAMSACYSGNSSGARVGDLGDSITSLATWDINDTLAPNYFVNVQGQPGYTFGESMPELQTMLTDPEGAPQDFIVELGPNDVFQGDPGWQTDLTTMASDLASTPCVIYVNVSTLLDAQWPGTGVTAEDINSGIDQVVASNPNSHILDWNTWTLTGTNATDYLYQDSYYLGTNIHPNPAGQQQLANLEMAAVRQDCGN